MVLGFRAALPNTFHPVCRHILNRRPRQKKLDAALFSFEASKSKPADCWKFDDTYWPTKIYLTIIMEVALVMLIATSFLCWWKKIAVSECHVEIFSHFLGPFTAGTINQQLSISSYKWLRYLSFIINSIDYSCCY